MQKAPASARRPRRQRAERLPFQELDLAKAGFLSLSMTLNTKLHRDAARSLRKVGTREPDRRVVVATSRTYREQGQDYGVGLRAEVGPDDATIAELEYRRGRTPRQSKAQFDDVWGPLVYPATSGPVSAFVLAVVELTPERLARLPVHLPLEVPGLRPGVGSVRGVRVVSERDGQRLYEAWLDVHDDGPAVTLIFQREVPQVATAAEDLKRAATELLDVFLVGGDENATG